MSKKPPLRYTIYRQLLDDILTGRINAGEKLLEAELAGRFRVSRTPIREALLQLEREGFIVHTKDVGAVVRKTSAEQVAETLDLVALLEGHATQLAVAEITEKDIALLTGLHLSMQECAEQDRFSTYVKLNAEFHAFFTVKCGNKKLRDTVLDLRKSIYRVLAEGQTLPRHMAEYIVSHQRIIDAATRGDFLNAGELMNSHVLDSKRYILERYDRFKHTTALSTEGPNWD